jgi:hypothetical protein
MERVIGSGIYLSPSLFMTILGNESRVASRAHYALADSMRRDMPLPQIAVAKRSRAHNHESQDTGASHPGHRSLEDCLAPFRLFCVFM